MPKDDPEWLERTQVLTFEEIEQFVRISALEGVTKVRLTGGEPLVRRDLPKLVARIARIGGIRDLAMTTNGTLLSRFARDLKDAGLTRLNVSLDSLNPERFAQITKSDLFRQVWGGIEAALHAGFSPLKINMVVIRGFNDDELVSFARLTRQYPFHVRFIEYMPIGGDREGWERAKVVPCAEIRAAIEAHEELEPVTVNANDAGPERVFRLKNSAGRMGFISPVSDDFCARCNRVRLTSDGKLRGCLMRDGEVDFRTALRTGASDEELRALLHDAMRHKPEKHLINSPDFAYTSFYTMNRLGG
jgi:cyclic pyranopterin phosphate synthase